MGFFFVRIQLTDIDDLYILQCDHVSNIFVIISIRADNMIDSAF